MDSSARSRFIPTPAHIGLLLTVAALTIGGVEHVAGQTPPTGEAVMAWHVTIAPTLVRSRPTAPPQITPFGMLYAIHDALVRPLPGQKMGPSLAESWTESPDGKVVRVQAAPRARRSTTAIPSPRRT